VRVDILTLHPELCVGPLEHSMIGRARAAGLVEVGVADIRDHGLGRHRTVDDAPFGGGSGMLMRVDVVDAAISAIRRPDSRVILMDPGGARFTQADAVRLAGLPHLVLVCGHYEGVDARVGAHLVDEALSVGDYVLTGGELAAMVIADAVLRLCPGVLGNPESSQVESFSAGPNGEVGLEAPHYTRPREYRGWPVPDVLLSGDHRRIESWRLAQAAARTRLVRPDLAIEPEPVPAPPPRRRRRSPSTDSNSDH
jgi:tRNA (guanine37-N1)-methyltransferase